MNSVVCLCKLHRFPIFHISAIRITFCSPQGPIKAKRPRLPRLGPPFELRTDIYQQSNVVREKVAGAEDEAGCKENAGPDEAWICNLWCQNCLMASDFNNEKEQAHEPIDRLAPKRGSAMFSLLEAMLDPVSRAVANAPVDDEPESEHERKAVAQSKEWFTRRGAKRSPAKKCSPTLVSPELSKTPILRFAMSNFRRAGRLTALRRDVKFDLQPR